MCQQLEKEEKRAALQGKKYQVHTLTKYKLTPEEYQELLERQEGRCAICDLIPSTRRLCIDHDHLTGQVRGLLCVTCNLGLGYFADDPERLAKAAEYLIAAHASP